MAGGTDSGRGQPARAGLTAVALETLAATGVALWTSLRWDTSLAWLVVPLGLLAACRRPAAEYGLDLRLTPPSPRTHLSLAAALLVLYGALHAAFALAVSGLAFAPAPPARPLRDLIEEFLRTAVPEEVFFRGFVQTRWNRALGTPWRLFGARLGPALLVQALLFALCHLASGDWTRLRVFCFALLAGWLRERSGSVLAPAVYHAVGNVWQRWLEDSFG